MMAFPRPNHVAKDRIDKSYAVTESDSATSVGHGGGEDGILQAADTKATNCS
jgi:hypothetical protein